jgi:thiol-disulfide isomerase/thioredoxin
MKKWFQKKSNILTLIVVAYLIYQKGPILFANFQNEGTFLGSKEFVVLGDKSNTKVSFPPVDTKAMAIFWATWCGPCKIEMERLKSSVEAGKIPKEKIFAINPFESEDVSRTFLKQNNFPFVFIHAPDISKKLDIQLTPSTIFVDKGRVESISSGLSVIGIWKAEFLLN